MISHACLTQTLFCIKSSLTDNAITDISYINLNYRLMILIQGKFTINSNVHNPGNQKLDICFYFPRKKSKSVNSCGREFKIVHSFSTEYLLHSFFIHFIKKPISYAKLVQTKFTFIGKQINVHKNFGYLGREMFEWTVLQDISWRAGQTGCQLPSELELALVDINRISYG